MWIKQDNELSFTASKIEALEKIPNGNWLMKFSQKKGYYLEKTSDFKLPPKIYGNAESLSERYLNTFEDHENNLGVLLTGLKGTGKSVTAKLVAAKSNRPVIIISDPFFDNSFKSFLNNITQEVIVFIDEFEKVYYENTWQNNFLSILDGVFEGKKMFLFTSNEKDRINKYMLNRPGRVHYLEEYESLPQSIINDVIDDNLDNKEHREGLLEVLNILTDVTMDMVISLIKEMNTYNEPARDAIKFLNLKPDQANFNCEVMQGDTKVGTHTVRYHPLTKEKIHIDIYKNDLSEFNAQERDKQTLSGGKVSFSGGKVSLDSSSSGVLGEIMMGNTEDMEKDKADVPSDKPKTKSGYIMFTLEPPKMKKETLGNKIILYGDNNMRFVFSKKETYSFNW